MKMKIVRTQLLNKLQRNIRIPGTFDDTIEHEPVTNQDARKFTAGLQLYFMQEGNVVRPISTLQTVNESNLFLGKIFFCDLHQLFQLI
jgi:hypothetical protein